MKLSLPGDSTSVIDVVVIRDDSFVHKTGLAYDTADFTCYRVLEDGTSAAVTLETIATLGTYAAPTSNVHMRFKELDATNLPGAYQVQYHNDWFAISSGNRWVYYQLKGTSLDQCDVQIQVHSLEIDVADQVWDEALSDHLTGGSTGAQLNKIGTSTYTVSSPVASDGDIEVYPDTDYDGNSKLTITISDWTGVDVNGDAGKLRFLERSEYLGDTTEANLEMTCDSVGQSGSTVTVVQTITAANLATLRTSPPDAPKNYRSQIEVSKAVAQVTTVTVGGVLAGETFTISVGGVAIASHTDATTDIADTVAALVAAWNASGHEYATPITAADASPDITLTADVVGVPFVITLNTPGVDATFTQVATTPSHMRYLLLDSETTISKTIATTS